MTKRQWAGNENVLRSFHISFNPKISPAKLIPNVLTTIITNAMGHVDYI